MNKEAIKLARKQIFVAIEAYRFEIKKQRLLGKQANVKDTLKKMGVVNRQISVMVMDSKPQKIKVRIA